MTVYARVNAANTAIVIFPVVSSDLNRSCSAAAQDITGQPVSVTLPPNPTDATLIRYQHVRVREERPPAAPTGGSVTPLAPAKEPDTFWWIRHTVTQPTAGEVTQGKADLKANVDSLVAWFNNVEALVVDSGAQLKTDIDNAADLDAARALWVPYNGY